MNSDSNDQSIQHVVKRLQQSSPRSRIKILKSCPDSVIQCLCELCNQFLQGKVGVGNMRDFVKHKLQLRRLSSLRHSPNRARRYITQRGGAKPLMRLIAWKTGMQPEQIEKYVWWFNGLRNWGLV